jgi:DnaJ family protein C protein 17
MPSETLYDLLGLTNRQATAGEVRTAYRQRSLKVHPDRNPSPEAATLFNALFEAYELLKDPARRDKYDQELAAVEARAQRFSALDNKRKAQVADLEAREEAFKKSREDGMTEQRRKDLELQRLKDEGQRLRREKDQQERDRRETALSASVAPSDARTSVQALNPLDTTLRLKFPRSPVFDADPEASLRALMAAHVPAEAIDSLVVSTKVKASPSKSKSGSAVVSLRTLNATVKLVKAAEDGKLPPGFEVKWAAGEVPKLARAAMGLMEAEQDSDAPSSSAVSMPPGWRSWIDSRVQALRQQTPVSVEAGAIREDGILARMKARQAERKKLEDDIRRQEALED